VGHKRADAFVAYEAEAAAVVQRAMKDGGNPGWLARHGISVRADGRWRSVFELAGLPNAPLHAVTSAFPWLQGLASRHLNHLQTEARYKGYLGRQQADIHAFRREERLRLGGIAFADIGGISAELKAKLTQARPLSLGAASRIQGMTPAALVAIAAHARKQENAA
jgi:tRNA uridine 5-carboxymethylaminomethyl modification enzyme